MAKYYGKIGYSQTVETAEGVYEEQIVERSYYGDVVNYYVKPSESSEGLNSNVRVSNKISIVSDSFAMKHVGYMKYLVWKGIRWKIQTAEIAFPRILLTLGDLYNEPSN